MILLQDETQKRLKEKSLLGDMETWWGWGGGLTGEGENCSSVQKLKITSQRKVFYDQQGLEFKNFIFLLFK